MHSPADFRPTERFTGLAQLYSQHRPSYPDEAVSFIISHSHLTDQSILVDIGCGTGISSRQFAERGIPVIGIEPNEEMRKQAQLESLPEGSPTPSYREGRAEATGLDAGSADAVLAAQAFHWFVAHEALREFHRILKPEGFAVLLWNERDESDPFTRAYGDGVRQLADTEGIEPLHGRGDVLLTSPLFHESVQAFFAHKQKLDEAGLMGRAFSASYAPREGAMAKLYAEEIHQLFRHFQQNGQIVMHYQTSVFLARRRALVSSSTRR
jgi:SAM-dependent methyltransferase